MGALLDTPDTPLATQLIESDRLRQRWGCSRRYLRDLEQRGVLPRARWVLGKLRYRLSDVEAAEQRFVNGEQGDAEEREMAHDDCAGAGHGHGLRSGKHSELADRDRARAGQPSED